MKSLVFAAALLLPVTASAQGVVTKPGSWIPLGCGTLPSMASAVTLSGVSMNDGTTGVPKGAVSAVFNISGASVNYWDDGTTPTASAGITLPTGITTYLGGLGTIKLIQTTNTATGTVCFYK